MKVSVFGLGYVGSVTAVCLAELGHDVIGVDIHAPKVDAMQHGRPPVQESQLQPLLEKHLEAGRLHVTMDSAYAVKSTTCSVVAVGTPSSQDGSVDLSAVERCVESIALALGDAADKPEHTIIIRSTVPPGTANRMLDLAARLSDRTVGESILGGMNPEFLREGVAVEDFFAPSVIVLGADDEASLAVMRGLYEGVEAERVALPTRTAEMVKYTNNAFHALKIAFANEIGRVAEACGVDGDLVMDVLCRDDKLNISAKYLRPGFAYGGSCLPKDLRGINHLATQHAVEAPLLRAVPESNDRHIDRAVDRVLAQKPKQVGVLGITFKPGTDDVRESAALHLVQRLRARGVDVRMFDTNVDRKHLLGANRRYIEAILPEWQDVTVESAEALFSFADVLVLTSGEPAHVELAQTLGKGTSVVDLEGDFRTHPAEATA